MINLDDISVDSPNVANAVCYVSSFTIDVRGRSVCELDVKSQPVKACSAATELHNTEPIACASFIISTYRLVLLLLNVKAE